MTFLIFIAGFFVVGTIIDVIVERRSMKVSCPACQETFLNVHIRCPFCSCRMMGEGSRLLKFDGDGKIIPLVKQFLIAQKGRDYVGIWFMLIFGVEVAINEKESNSLREWKKRNGKILHEEI